MRRPALLFTLTALVLAAMAAPLAQASDDAVGASYLFVLQGDNGGETPVIQIEGTVKVAEEGTTTAQVTMTVRDNGVQATYRSSSNTTVQIDDNSVVIQTEMIALDLAGTRPSPPVTLSVEATIEPRDNHPDFLWQPAGYFVGETELEGQLFSFGKLKVEGDF